LTRLRIRNAGLTGGMPFGFARHDVRIAAGERSSKGWRMDDFAHNNAQNKIM